MEVAQSEITQETWDEWRGLMTSLECAVCGADLTIRTMPARATLVLGCPNPEHTGFRQRTLFTEEMRRGEEIYPAIRDSIEAKMMEKTGFNRAMNLLALRFPDAIKDKAGAALFINDCMRLGLDPLIQPAEAVPIPFKTKDKSGKEKATVAMVVTEDGALSMAARGCPEEYDGAPATMPLLDYLMKEHPERSYDELTVMAKRTAKELCDDAEAYIWVALGKRRSASSVQPAYGYFPQAERNKALDRRLPAGTQPGNQARIRAVKRWVRENFPEARQKMMEYTRELHSRGEGITAAEEIIDAEYSILTGPVDKPSLLEKKSGQQSKHQTNTAQTHPSTKAKKFSESETGKQPAGGGVGPAIDEDNFLADEETQNQKNRETSAAGLHPSSPTRTTDMQMLKWAAGKLRWDTKRLRHELKTRFGEEDMNKFGDQTLHDAASKIAFLADLA